MGYDSRNRGTVLFAADCGWAASDADRPTASAVGVDPVLRLGPVSADPSALLLRMDFWGTKRDLRQRFGGPPPWPVRALARKPASHHQKRDLRQRFGGPPPWPVRALARKPASHHQWNRQRGFPGSVVCSRKARQPL